MAVTDEAIARIKEMIVSGLLPAGARLPREEDLAVQLGISRNSLREAVRALTAMRILISRQGDGTYVSSLEPHLLLEELSFVADVSHGDSAAQLLEVRRLLEPQATALAANRITDQGLAALRVILESSMKADSVETFIEWDIAFHRAIVDTIGNPVLSLLLDTLSTHTQRVRIVRGAHLATALESVHREHESILRALEAHDGQLAASAAMLHVSAVEQWLQARTTDLLAGGQ
ncbi:GntR family transcriptional regulator [Streptomyces sp. 846.5]|jgi:GntR family transcriptional repressor for pyruvate dehydrogenase complex|nr:FadR/GntR family transcriptional regulator [Streptomyces sp. 846.5]TDU06673.1 GntR family transcriptional regulator [Streptomyces sp. 846.5]